MFSFCNHFINNGSNNSAFYTRVAIKTSVCVSSLFFFSRGSTEPFKLVFREREKGEGRRKRERERVTSALFLVMFFSEKLYPV